MVRRKVFRKMIGKVSLLVYSLLFFVVASYGQNPPLKVSGTTLSSVTKKGESGVSVAVVQNGATLKSVTSASTGKYDLECGNIDYSKVFELVFSKGGFYSKKVLFNFTKINPEDGMDAMVQPWTNNECEMIAKATPGDFSFLESEPIEKFGNGTNMTEDVSYATRMQDKIAKAINDGKGATDKEAQYQAIIKEADKLYQTDKKLEEAMKKYEEASKIKASETYPIQRIEEIDGILKLKKEKELADQQANAEYYKLIKEADLYFSQNRYNEAVSKYEAALNKKQDEYPKNQIKLAKEKQAAIDLTAGNKKKYEDAILLADNFFKQKNYAEAEKKYTEARQYDEANTYPPKQLELIKNLMAADAKTKETKEKYDAAIKAGDDLFAQENWEGAKKKYQEASGFDNLNAYPAGRIKLCDQKISEALSKKSKDEQIQALIKEGDKLYDEERWTESRNKFSDVLKLDPANQKAKDRIAAIEKWQAELLQMEKNNELYKKKVEEADALFNAKKYPEAEKKYLEAQQMKSDKAVELKIEEIKKILLAAQSDKEKELAFQKFKSEGLDLAGQKKWSESLVQLKQADAIKNDPAVKAKLLQVQQEYTKDSIANKLNADFNLRMNEAQQFETDKKYSEAIAKYTDASAIKPNEPLPKSKISSLQELMKNQENQAGIDKQYKEFMDKGNASLLKKQYEPAIEDFQKALKLKPNEQEPKNKIEQAQNENQKEKDSIFEEMLKASEKAISEKKWDEAKSRAESAKKARPEDKRPENLLKRIEEIVKQENDYKLKMAEAEAKVKSNDYKLAIQLFQEAQTIDVNALEPAKRIKEVSILDSEADSKKQKELNYTARMNEGKAAMDSNRYVEAIAAFTAAEAVKSGDKMALQKKKEAEELLNKENARKKSEEALQNKINDLVNKGNESLSSFKYDDAIRYYEEALLLDKKSTTIPILIESAQKLKEKQERDNALAQYNQWIQNADESFDIKAYDTARVLYKKAIDSKIKPDDRYPSDQLLEIDRQLYNNAVVGKKIEQIGILIPNDSSVSIGQGNYNLSVQQDIDAVKQSVMDSDQKNDQLLSQRNAAINQDINKSKNEVLQSQSKENDGHQQKVNEIVKLKNEISEYNYQEKIYRENDEMLMNEVINYQKQQATEQNKSGDDHHRKVVESVENTKYGIESQQYDAAKNESLREATISKEITTKKSDVQQSSVITDNHHQDVTKEINEIKTDVSSEQFRTKGFEDKRQSVITDEINELQQNTQQNNVNSENHHQEVNQQITEVKTAVSAFGNLESQQEINRHQVIIGNVNDIKSDVQTQELKTSEHHLSVTTELQKSQEDVHQTAFIQSKMRDKIEWEQNKEISELKEQANAMKTDNRDKEINASIVEIKNQVNNQIYNDQKKSDQNQSLQVEQINNLKASQQQTYSAEASRNAAVNQDINKIKNDVSQAAYQQAKNQQKVDILSLLNPSDTSERKDPFIYNEIGKQYGEGVTEEKSITKDANGNIACVITTRIVVRNGYGVVYRKISTASGITTYTKDGTNILATDWGRETSKVPVKTNR